MVRLKYCLTTFVHWCLSSLSVFVLASPEKNGLYWSRCLNFLSTTNQVISLYFEELVESWKTYKKGLNCLTYLDELKQCINYWSHIFLLRVLFFNWMHTIAKLFYTYTVVIVHLYLFNLYMLYSIWNYASYTHYIVFY